MKLITSVSNPGNKQKSQNCGESGMYDESLSMAALAPVISITLNSIIANDLE
jgi:hypothetical protein